ncbi:MAG: Sjogren's syndrome/scleroderma autoantigen 1 family protein [Nitrososphaerales archaeon]
MSKERISTAAELLRKGGTLVSESCSVCRGIQVRFSGKIICVNCGKEEVMGVTETGKEAKTGEVVTDLKNIVLSKIGALLPSLKSEEDLDKQTEVIKLIKHYLEVLEKIPRNVAS